jgi:hypothetical protein
MAESTQCASCGASLAPEDQFCGECGAPRPAPSPESPAPLAPASLLEVPGQAPVSVTRPRALSEGRRTATRIIAILSAAAAVGLCGMGLVLTFLAPDSQTGQAGSVDMIVGSAILCFFPGLLALVLAVVLWLFVERRQ